MYLGQDTEYSDQYDPSLLVAIPRAQNRDQLALDAFDWLGVDLWTAYELSWLNTQGLPQVAVIELQIDARSQSIVESKSLKYYLNSFNQSHFENADAVAKRISEDLTALLQGDVKLQFAGEALSFQVEAPLGECLDNQECEIHHYVPEPGLLGCSSEELIEESLYSHLLKSNCPVTAQPDWATIWINYRGKSIDRKGLLAYICSYRQHQGFHEHCVEQIFCDLLQQCEPECLTVYARYTRRGGIDINPLRTTLKACEIPFRRTLRQ